MKLKELFEEDRTYEKAFTPRWGTWEKNIDCSFQQLTSLEGCPQLIRGDFNCENNKLTSLVGSPRRIEGEFYGNNAGKLESLEGCPRYVVSDFYIKNCGLTNLHNIHKHIDYIGDTLYVTLNPIKSHILGILKIDGLWSVWLDNKEVTKILHKYLKGIPVRERDILACQQELIDAGFEEYAQL